MKPLKLSTASAAIAVALSTPICEAGTIQVGGMAAGADGKISAKPGVCTVTFNAGTAANACGAIYSDPGGGFSSSHIRTGSAAGQYLSPSGDTTAFLTVGPTDGTPITITLASLVNYFGFYAGSLDSYNLVQFYIGSVLVDSFTGTDINAVAFPSGSTASNASAFIDYFPTSFYDRIVYSSSLNAFETDSHAFGIASPTVVPEPSSAMLLALGAIALTGTLRGTQRTRTPLRRQPG